MEDHSKNIAALARMFAPIIEAGPHIERLGSMAAAEKDLERRLEGLRKEEGDLRGTIASKRATFAADEGNHKRAMADAQTACEHVKREADKYASLKRSEGDDALRAGQVKAASLIEAANKDVAELLADAGQKIEASKVQMRREHEDVRAQMTQTRAAMKSEHDVHSARISDIAKIADRVKSEGDDYLAKKRGEVAAILKGAQAEAAKIIDAGKDKAKRLESEAVNTVSNYRGQLIAAECDLTAVKQAIAEAKAEFERQKADFERNKGEMENEAAKERSDRLLHEAATSMADYRRQITDSAQELEAIRSQIDASKSALASIS